MRLNNSLSNLIELNLAVLFISTSGVLGRYIELPVPLTIFLRALFAALFLWIYIWWRKHSLSLKSKDRTRILMSGLFMGLHWVTYFYSLQVSNVAIAVISLYTFPVITSILEPLILKTKFLRSHLLSGVIVVLGMYILTPEFNLNSGLFKGVCFGVLSAFCYAVRNIILKPKVNTYNQSSLMLYQMIVVSVLLIPSLYYFEIGSTLQYLPALTVLALITTVIGHTMFVKSLKHFSASSASLISSMQPLYGILLAFFFLNEQPSLQSFIGGTLIVGAVIIESIQLNRN